MEKATILKVAGVCGVVASAGFLAAHLPPESAFRDRRGGGMMMRATLPTSLAEAESAIMTPDHRDNYESWFNLAGLRRDAGSAEAERLAWEEAARLATAEAQRIDWPRPCYMAAFAYYKLGRTDEARAAAVKAEKRYNEMQAAGRTAGGHTYWYRLGWVRAIRGDQEGSREAWRRALETLEGQDPQRTFGLDWYNIACYRALLGEHAGAIEALRKAVEGGYGEAGHIEHDEDLESLRGDPEFGAVLEKARSRQILEGG
jgi:tetratricopeptide (TPR) repeat protein